MHKVLPKPVLASAPRVLREERHLLELDRARRVKQKAERHEAGLLRRHDGLVALPVGQREYGGLGLRPDDHVAVRDGILEERGAVGIRRLVDRPPVLLRQSRHPAAARVELPAVDADRAPVEAAVRDVNRDRFRRPGATGHQQEKACANFTFSQHVFTSIPVPNARERVSAFAPSFQPCRSAKSR